MLFLAGEKKENSDDSKLIDIILSHPSDLCLVLIHSEVSTIRGLIIDAVCMKGTLASWDRITFIPACIVLP